ncbi:DUF4192 domain-containing protein [Arthrobacter sp. NtRootA1]|uniref:DUF4192 domain-containing protein n=1 Tax=Arthrobacter sp. NtRootA1 TaxID=2830983 RepID=UPI001CC605C3|nr:DUF4192 domain-containing protein [Arthrobacter sp. NtRootA1]BCW06075.1 hypothetical protein NtRootA1_22130 [Arthrobacter sp. NtRootA1]
MNALTIKDPADLPSFIGHTLRFWPQESLVCVTLDNDKVGATLRIDRLQLALDTDPGYRFARLSDQMLGAGIIAGWNTNRDTAYKAHLDMP